jgi:hypothetical protein
MNVQPPRQAGYMTSSRCLEGEARRTFEALIATRGITRTAELLRVGDATISRLRDGGFASPKAVARVTARLLELRKEGQ